MSANRKKSFWHMRVGTVEGIPIHLHVTFVLMFAFLWLAEAVLRTNEFLILPAAFFACILSHEAGHCLVARRFGVKTDRITLYPFGGAAFLRNAPHFRHEALIAIAGPFVNVVIILLLLPFGSWNAWPKLTNPGLDQGFIENMIAFNIGVILFNLLPLFPMDGGRILRSLLSYRIGYKKATICCVVLAFILATAMIGHAFTTMELNRLVIGVIMGFMAWVELAVVLLGPPIEGRTASEAMVTVFPRIYPGTTVREVLALMDESSTALVGTLSDWPCPRLKSVDQLPLASSPVYEGGEFVGAVHRSDMVFLKREGKGDVPVREFIDHGQSVVKPSTPLEHVLRDHEEELDDGVFVMHGGQVLGVVTANSILTLIREVESDLMESLGLVAT